MTTNGDPASSTEPFNSHGFWKAIILEPDGRTLTPVPLTAIVAPDDPGEPRFFVYWRDTVMDCEDVPGFIAALGADDMTDTGYRSLFETPDVLNRLARWTDVFEKRRKSETRVLRHASVRRRR